MSVHTMPYLPLNLNPVRAGIFIVNLQMWKLRRSEKAEGYPNSTASNVLPWISHLTLLGCRGAHLKLSENSIYFMGFFLGLNESEPWRE